MPRAMNKHGYALSVREPEYTAASSQALVCARCRRLREVHLQQEFRDRRNRLHEALPTDEKGKIQMSDIHQLPQRKHRQDRRPRVAELTTLRNNASLLEQQVLTCVAKAKDDITRLHDLGVQVAEEARRGQELCAKLSASVEQITGNTIDERASTRAGGRADEPPGQPVGRARHYPAPARIAWGGGRAVTHHDRDCRAAEPRIHDQFHVGNSVIGRRSPPNRVG